MNLYGKLGREGSHPTMKTSRKLLLCHNQLQNSETEADLNFPSSWESPEANSLFLPVQNESIPECLGFWATIR